MMKVFIVCFFFMFSFNAEAQIKKYNPDDIDSLLSLNQRMIVVFISGDWCKYCDMMKHSTFKNDELIDHLNDDFFFIELNENYKNRIIFNNKTYHYVGQSEDHGKHELAIELGKNEGKYVLPGLCVLDKNSKAVFRYGGYMSADDLIINLRKLN